VAPRGGTGEGREGATGRRALAGGGHRRSASRWDEEKAERDGLGGALAKVDGAIACSQPDEEETGEGSIGAGSGRGRVPLGRGGRWEAGIFSVFLCVSPQMT
jgi:hypothetical protein